MKNSILIRLIPCTAIFLTFLSSENVNANQNFPYTFSELGIELSNLSDGVIQTKTNLPVIARDTTFKKAGASFITEKNPSGLDPQNFFAIDISKFNLQINAEDFLTAKRIFYSRLSFNKHTQRYYRPYSYLESWRSLFHPQIKSLEVAVTTIDKNMTQLKDGERAAADSPYFNSDLNREIDAISGSELTMGNDLELRVLSLNLPHLAPYSSMAQT